jgi:hypothetical protein
MEQELADSRRYVGRWRLPSGQAFKVVWIIGDRALVGDGRRRWKMPLADLRVLVGSGRLTYVGK